MIRNILIVSSCKTLLNTVFLHNNGWNNSITSSGGEEVRTRKAARTLEGLGLSPKTLQRTCNTWYGLFSIRAYDMRVERKKGVSLWQIFNC